MFEIHIDNQPEKFIQESDEKLKKRILKKIKSLGENPFPHSTKRVINRKEKTFRIRVGDYRILYVVFQKEKSILISKIDKRSKAYL
jgi:mRNA interferase RelE/StbE